jgi:hypothetical protein
VRAGHCPQARRLNFSPRLRSSSSEKRPLEDRLPAQACDACAISVRHTTISPQNAFDLAFVVQARGSNFAILTARKQAGTQLTAAMAAADSGQQPLDERRRILGRGRASGPGSSSPRPRPRSAAGTAALDTSVPGPSDGSPGEKRCLRIPISCPDGIRFTPIKVRGCSRGESRL